MTKDEFISFSKTLPEEVTAKVISIKDNEDVFTFLKRGNWIRILRNVQTMKRLPMFERAPWYKRIFGTKLIPIKYPFYMRLERLGHGLHFVTLSRVLFSKGDKTDKRTRKGFCASVHNVIREYDALVIIHEDSYNLKYFIVCKSTKQQ